MRSIQNILRGGNGRGASWVGVLLIIGIAILLVPMLLGLLKGVLMLLVQVAFLLFVLMLLLYGIRVLIGKRM